MTTIPALIRDLHAAGWTYRLAHDESPRDFDGAPEHEGWYVHRWTRGKAEVSVARRVDGALDGDVLYYGSTEDPRDVGEGSPERAIVGLGLVQRHGAQILRDLGISVGAFQTVEMLARWRPLESRLPADRWTDWMWMGSVEHGGRRIEQYKHHETRAYLNLDHDGRAWRVVFREKDWDPWCGVDYDSLPTPAPEIEPLPFDEALAGATR